MKPTAVRILDAAENLFAAKGYQATSLGEVADAVGIRSPSLYNHFKNKEALYNAVLDRLLLLFNAPLEELLGTEVTQQSVLQWQSNLVRLHTGNPNLSRLLQHAALSGGPQVQDTLAKLFQPLFSYSNGVSTALAPVMEGHAELLPWIVMAFNNIVMSYVTMAPMYKDMLGVDPFSDEAIERQIKTIGLLTEAYLEAGMRKGGSDQ
ncbi:TetR family transcriptional regulator [Sinobacterium caligoides]|uniref:TetR family transcriptional regulator n=1 Tax=Sinobacterium caligoides TaxID=933926 RepID=A0A3N2D5F0_9GAMM|nr:TetR/AcrR family transcriptional regulator [Sinobacterium caligoides]ROR94858.1 TetR family transcriptional regulator [Sinobacterium caligoides]